MLDHPRRDMLPDMATKHIQPYSFFPIEVIKVLLLDITVARIAVSQSCVQAFNRGAMLCLHLGLTRLPHNFERGETAFREGRHA